MKNLFLFFLFSSSLAMGQVLQNDPSNTIDPGAGGGSCLDSEKVFLYRDFDGDGYGSTTGMLICPNTAGWVNNDDDCDDSDPNLFPQTWYPDRDGDGVGKGPLAMVHCGKPPGLINYELSNNDCNDDPNNDGADVGAPRIWYRDADGDEKGDFFNPTDTELCVPPHGYVSDSSDCNDLDGNNHIYTWYKDYDRDGLGDPNQSVNSCFPPNSWWISVAGDNCPNYAGEPSNNGCPTGNVEEEPWNTIKTISYDLDGLPIAKSKAYYDCLGKNVQNLSLDFTTNKTWANQVIYDSQGRPALTTLSSPAWNAETFLYKEDFVMSNSGTPVVPADLDDNSVDAPRIADDNLTLGWFYSIRNNDQIGGNNLRDITDRPYTRTVYSKLNPGSVLRTEGGNKPAGTAEWKNSYSFTMKAGQELTQDVAFNDPAYDSSNYKILKTVTRDVHDVENVVFTDTDGKTLASARSGPEGTIRNNTVTIGEQGFIDIHIPLGITGYILNRPPDVHVQTYNLITEELVTGHSTTLPSGFYRIAVVDPESYVANSISVTYKDNYYDYSLNKYDDLGKLTSSTQPLDFSRPNASLETFFEYDNRGQLIRSESPDEGVARFKYRNDGQIRFSQNSKQEGLNQVSYTNYDEIGRPIESGVLSNAAFDSLDPDEELPASLSRSEQLFTQYDYVTQTQIQILPANYRNPHFLAGNVAMTTNFEVSTFYSYDIYGRVEWMVQVIEGLGAKTLDYRYDPLTGSVTSVIYQKNNTEEFFEHRYKYDIIDNSLVSVETSTDGRRYLKHAQYDYYETGELKRKDIGDGLQGIDYVYNLSGQLKAINHPSLTAAMDPGGDDDDFFGMTVDYYKGDYMRDHDFSPLMNSGTNQYNGNIKGIRWNTHGFQSHAEYLYSYNRNNWLTGADYNSPGSNNGDYDVSNIRYDANGNIETLRRNGPDDQGLLTMDNLSYEYKDDKPNQLSYVRDAFGDRDVGDMGDQLANNYRYNSIGQLTHNDENSLEYFYNTAGLVTRIDRDGNPVITFHYDDKGKRYKKVSYRDGSVVNTTYYVRDAAGSPTAIYTSEGGQQSRLEEHSIYGSGRVGIYKRQLETTLYQMTDHLGNVRAVIQKNDNGDALGVIAKTDYYPFGMPMPNRDDGASEYRYGYQGEFSEKEDAELTGSTNSFELRLWDARIGRWLSTDPYGQYSSPYLGMGNNPISGIDPDGGFTDFLNSETGNHVHVDDGFDDIVIVDPDNWNSVINYAESYNFFQLVHSQALTDIMNQGSVHSKNDFGVYRFPESGPGFARYSTSFNNENYYVDGVHRTGDNYISSSAFIALYQTFSDFHDFWGGTMHYGDISAYDPRIQLGHSSHFRGSAIDIHYISESGTELSGNSAYNSAGYWAQTFFFLIAEEHGFTSNFSYGNRWMHSTSTTNGRNQGLHRDHLHIGLPDSWTHRQRGVSYGSSATVPLPH